MAVTSQDGDNTIQLSISAESPYIEGECAAGASISPGHLLERTPADTLDVHGLAARFAQKMFATEDIHDGGTIDTPYTPGMRVKARICRKGDVVRAIAPFGEAIAEGTFLTSNGNGELKVAGGGNDIVAVMKETITGSGERRIKVGIV